MKRLFVMAMLIICAVACGKKQLTVEEQMTEYQNRIMEALDIINDEAIIEAKGTKAWYNALSEDDKEQVTKACEEIENIRHEMMEWTKTLSMEDKAKVKEFGKGVMSEDYLHKIRHVYSLTRLIAKPAIVEPTK